MIRLVIILFTAVPLAAQGMDPADSAGLVRLQELRSIYDPSGGDWETAVEMAHLLHDLRRDKPALRILVTVPGDNLGPSDRLFLASLHLFDSDIPAAFAAAAPVCIVPIAVITAAALLSVVLIIRRRKGRNG